MQEHLRQLGQDVDTGDALSAMAALQVRFQTGKQGQQKRNGGITSRKRRYVATYADSQDQDSTSESEDDEDSPPSEKSAAPQVASPVSSSRNPREESLAVDDAENPLQLLARASNLHLSPPSSEHTGSGAVVSGSLHSILNHNTKDIAEIERFFNSTQFSLDTESDMDPINLGLLSEDEGDALFIL